MKKAILIVLIMGLFVSLFTPLSQANNLDNTIVFQSISSLESKSRNPEANYLTVYSISGIRNMLYFAFNFSEFPANADPTFAVFKVETKVIFDACYIDAFYSPSAEWVATNLTEGSEPSITPFGGSNYVSYAEEWYSYTGSSFIQAVEKACKEKGMFTVCLRAQANAFGDSTVSVYPTARLEVIYDPITSNVVPTPSIPEFSSFTVVVVLAIILLSGVAVVYKRRTTKK